MLRGSSNESQNFLFTALEATKITKGLLVGDPQRVFSALSIDSRKVEDNSLFAALVGARVDAHDFIEELFNKGCRSFLVEKRDNALIERLSSQGASFIVVDKVLQAIQALATAHLDKFPNLIRIGVTGSSGKTTTKELLGSMLSEKYKVCMTEGNFNSEIGLPLMALRVRKEDEIVLLEMGIDHEGEMDDLAAILRPQYALVSYIGTAHIGSFGSQEKIANEKGRIFSYFTKDSVGFVSATDKLAKDQVEKYEGASVTYDLTSTGVNATDKGLLGWDILLESGEKGRLPLVGRYNLSNFCGALAVARHLGCSDSQILAGATKVERLFGRSVVKEVVSGGRTLFLMEDCYNANLESMKEAISFVADLEFIGKKKLVVASMKDLGEASEASHREVGKLLCECVAASEIQTVFLYGEETKWIKEELQNVGLENATFFTSEMNELEEAVASHVENGDFWLLKGSRSMALENLQSVFAA